MGIKEQLRIDKHALDVECIRHPMDYADASESMASATFLRDKLKEELELLRAEVDSEIRADPEEYGLVNKPTETSIRNTMIMDKRVIEKNKEYLVACYEHNSLLGIKTAFDHKKSCLEMLVKLYISGYWSDSVASSKDTEKIVDEATTDQLSENPRMKKRSKHEQV